MPDGVYNNGVDDLNYGIYAVIQRETYDAISTMPNNLYNDLCDQPYDAPDLLNEKLAIADKDLSTTGSRENKLLFTTNNVTNNKELCQICDR